MPVTILIRLIYPDYENRFLAEQDFIFAQSTGLDKSCGVLGPELLCRVDVECFFDVHICPEMTLVIYAGTSNVVTKEKGEACSQNVKMPFGL
jgi:hypothetical protein